MQETMKYFFTTIKRYWLFFVLCIIIIVLLIILIYAGELIERGGWPREVLSALLGAATVAVITFLLLKGQANNESMVEQSKKVFENRLKAYESFLATLQNVVVNNAVDEKSEKLLQFGIATIGMHADSKDLLAVSKNLKYILLKIKVQERADGSIWTELMEIVNVFRHSLYIDDQRQTDSDMRKALRNFSGLCVDENYEVLQFVECLLSSYHFDSYIIGKCLFFDIHTKKNYIMHRDYPSRIYVTLRIDDVTDDLYSGIVAIYCKKSEFWLLCKMMENANLWVSESLKFCKSDKKKVKLGVLIVEEAFVLEINKMTKMALQSAVGDIFLFMHPVWAEEGVGYLRKDNDGKPLFEIPSDKLP